MKKRRKIRDLRFEKKQGVRRTDRFAFTIRADIQSNKEALNGVKISSGKSEKCGFLGFGRG